MNFPYTAWRLTPSFKPVEVVIGRSYKAWDGDFLVSERGKYLRGSEVFPTKEQAVEFGRKRIAEMEAEITKREGMIAKKRAALDKAESA